jgi:uncharacterized protein YndB with AHSA1/START domain
VFLRFDLLGDADNHGAASIAQHDNCRKTGVVSFFWLAIELKGNQFVAFQKRIHLMNTPSNIDRIERSIVINAPRERVWRAISHAEEFGTWFGADLKGQAFVQNQRTRGRITACGHEDVWFDIVVDRIEPMHLLSFRWHPYAIDPTVDYSQEEATWVTFTLTDAPGTGTLLTVVESGFDQVPLHRRFEAFRMHRGGWDAQLTNVSRHAST